VDHSIDELLEAAPAAPLPDIGVPLDTLPPATTATQPGPAADEMPEPAVPPAAAASPEEVFSLESEVSEVRSTSGLREAAEVTVAAIAAEAEVIATEELSEDDLVEVTEASPGASVDVDFEDEQPPASSQRSRLPSSLDEALASAAQHEAEVDVPLKTPPPESGPQEAPAPATAAEAADVDALLAQEIDIPTREPIGVPPGLGPTPEQLGQTIDLEETRGPAIELLEHAHREERTAAAAAEELEVALPSREAAGGYDHTLAPPPDALSELEAHRRRLEEENIPAPPESLAQLPSVQPKVAAPPESAVVQAAPEAPLSPEVVARPIPAGAPEAFASVREPFRPSTFVELLDASLALHGD
jgi:hypothetical protein